MNNVGAITVLLVYLYSRQISLVRSAKIATDKIILKEVSLTDEFNEISVLPNEGEDAREANKLIKAQWGGNCTAKHWERCQELASLEMWGWEIKKDDRPKSPKYIHHVDNGKLNCTNETVLALKCFNKTWTVSRCHILCMSLCNRDLRKSSKYEKIYKDGPCEIDGVDTSLFPMSLGWNTNSTANFTEIENNGNAPSPNLLLTSSFWLLIFLISLQILL